MLRFAGAIAPDDLNEMAKAIAEGCEGANLNDWYILDLYEPCQCSVCQGLLCLFEPTSTSHGGLDIHILMRSELYETLLESESWTDVRT